MHLVQLRCGLTRLWANAKLDLAAFHGISSNDKV